MAKSESIYYYFTKIIVIFYLRNKFDIFLSINNKSVNLKLKIQSLTNKLYACINPDNRSLALNKKEMENQPASHLFVQISLLKIVFCLMIHQIQLFDIEIGNYFKQFLWWLLFPYLN